MKRPKLLALLIVVGSMLLVSFSFYAYQMVYTPNVLTDQSDRILLIPTEATFDEIQDRLHEEDYVKDLLSFSVLAKVMEYDQYLKPGRYLLKADMSNLAAIRQLRSGRQEPVNVTFNNVRLKPELAQRLCENLEADEEVFLALLNNENFVKEYGFTTENIMAMFLPNTYQFYWTTSAEELFERFYQEYENFWSEQRANQADSLNMTPREVSILASIVESETNKPDEAPKVAGLYLNRLQRNIALQADPTLVYAAGDFTIKRVLNKHKEIDSPYNTYRYTGLPPGPIRVPSISAIDAVLNYEDHNYLYMCAKEDFSGYHNFATNLTAHLANARRYQRALGQAGIYN
ncbi:endolytic transglycosylase MltG [Tunicatimonas pelagia]|uniref:endolytic transglycosylase MltG n=1 Tax=Tunicatimonas pelagia TaxID=931531 RepID=UPI002666F6EA|nr:endolytic transglycosylase MltG [Tunicatimonas pelagia]WKN44297.1 endolytic transglycosylase MltG [Tunicatimonas pelagia]